MRHEIHRHVETGNRAAAHNGRPKLRRITAMIDFAFTLRHAMRGKLQAIEDERKLRKASKRLIVCEE